MSFDITQAKEQMQHCSNMIDAFKNFPELQSDLSDTEQKVKEMQERLLLLDTPSSLTSKDPFHEIQSNDIKEVVEEVENLRKVCDVKIITMMKDFKIVPGKSDSMNLLQNVEKRVAAGYYLPELKEAEDKLRDALFRIIPLESLPPGVQENIVSMLDNEKLGKLFLLMEEGRPHAVKRQLETDKKSETQASLNILREAVRNIKEDHPLLAAINAAFLDLSNDTFDIKALETAIKASPDKDLLMGPFQKVKEQAGREVEVKDNIPEIGAITNEMITRINEKGSLEKLGLSNQEILSFVRSQRSRIKNLKLESKVSSSFEVQFIIDSCPNLEELKFSGNVSGLSFAKLVKLKKIDLGQCEGVTKEQIRELSSSLKDLDMHSLDVMGFDFSHLENLENVNLSACKKLTNAQFQQFPSSLKKMNLSCIYPIDFSFSKFLELKEINFSYVIVLENERFQELPESLERLDLSRVSTEGLSVAKFTRLKTIILWPRRYDIVTNELIQGISSSLEELILANAIVNSFSFSKFKNLKIVCLTECKGMTSHQFSQFPISLEKLFISNMEDISGFSLDKFKNLTQIIFWSLDVKDLSFIALKNLKEISLSCCKGFTNDQFHELSSSLEDLKIWGMSVSGWSFSKLENLKKVRLESEGLTLYQKEQVIAIIKKNGGTCTF
ncbi:MAG: hypothetical protein V4489_05275 [Chlamydiota bacterium]